MDAIMDMEQAYQKIFYSDPRHRIAAGYKGSHSYQVSYNGDGQLQITKDKNLDLFEESEEEEAEIQNISSSSCPPAAAEEIQQTQQFQAFSNDSMFTKSEENFLSEKASEEELSLLPLHPSTTNVALISTKSKEESLTQSLSQVFPSPESSATKLRVISQTTTYFVAQENELEEQNPSNKLLNHPSIKDFVTHQQSKVNQRNNNTPSGSNASVSPRKSVGFKPNLVEESFLDGNEKREIHISSRSFSPNKSSLRIRPNIVEVDSTEELFPSPIPSKKSLIKMITSTRIISENKPSSFHSKTFTSKIPISKRRFSSSKQLNNSSKDSSNVLSGKITTTCNSSIPKVGITKNTKRSSKGSRQDVKRRESVEKMLKTVNNNNNASQSYKVIHSSNSYKVLNSKKLTAKSSTIINTRPSSTKLTESDCSIGKEGGTIGSISNPNLNKNDETCKISQEEEKEKEPKERDSLMDQSIKVDSEENNEPNDGESTITLYYKMEDNDKFISDSKSIQIRSRNDEEEGSHLNCDTVLPIMMSSTLEEEEPLQSLKVTLPFSEKEVTLTPLPMTSARNAGTANSKLSPATKMQAEVTSKPSKSSHHHHHPSLSYVVDENSNEVKQGKSQGNISPCRFSPAGCKEEFPRGTLMEKDHTQQCEYRPLPCLFNPSVCNEIVPYNNYILHSKSHHIEPNYTRALMTPVILTKEDFLYNQTWIPKWLSYEGLHFFLMLSHRRGRKVGSNGIWVCWLQIFGNDEDAVNYCYEVEVFKGLKKISGIFTVQSVRTPVNEIEHSKSGLVFNDLVVKNISGIAGLEVTDIFIDVTISKKADSHKRQLSYTGPYKAIPIQTKKITS